MTMATWTVQTGSPIGQSKGTLRMTLHGGKLALTLLDFTKSVCCHTGDSAMRALLLDRIPNLAIANKDDARKSLNGVKVTDAGLVQALLRYGTYDEYLYIRESSSNHKADGYLNHDRLRALDLATVESLRTQSSDEMVLFTSGHQVAKFVPFRQFFGHGEWPICGRTHGLSSNTLIPSYLWNYFSDLHPHDAIVCTSRAGQQALSNIFDGLQTSRSVQPGGQCCRVQLPLMYIDGIDVIPARLPHWRERAGFVVIAMGRFTTSHKADLRPIISAFLRSKSLPQSATLILAGDDTQGNIAGDLDQFSRSFTSQRNVVVMPNVSDGTKKSLYDLADVALCLSDTLQETFGVSVLEAMAAGVPVIAPDWDGYRDIVIDGETGFLVHTAVLADNGLLNAVSMLIDPAFALGQRAVMDVEALIEDLVLLSRDRELSRQMGESGRRRAQEHFSWQSVVHRLEGLWSEQIDLAKNVGSKSTSGPIGYMDYDHVFLGHPTEWLDEQTTIRALHEDDDYLRRGLDGSLFSPPTVAGFSQKMDQATLHFIQGQGETSVGEVVKHLHSLDCGPSMVTTHLGRLLKYGLVSYERQPGYQSPEKETSHDSVADCALSSIGL